MQAEATNVSTDGSGNDAIMVVEGAAMDVQEDYDVGGPFSQGRPLPQAIRKQIVDLAQQGVRVNQIARQLNTTHGSVGKILARYYNTGSIQPRPQVGPKSKLATPELVEKIASYKRENPKIVPWEIRNKLVADGMFSTETVPSISSVRRILKNKIVDGQVLPGGSLTIRASPKSANSDEGDSTLLSPTTVDQRKLSHLAPDLSQQQAALQAGEIVTYESEEDLQNHMAADMQMKKSVSKDCDKSKERFRIHPCGRIDASNTTHKRTTRNKKSKSKTAEYICLHCTKTFHTRHGLRKHLIKDHSQKHPSTADKNKAVLTTHNPMKQINKDDSRKYSSTAVTEKAEQKKQVMTNEELVKLKIPVKELLKLKRAGEEKMKVKEETFERDIVSDVPFYGNDVADISFDGNDISDVSSDENDFLDVLSDEKDFLDVLSDENDVSDVFSDENDVSDHIPSDENDVSDHIPSDENDVSDHIPSDENDVSDHIPSDENDVSDFSSNKNDFSNVSSDGNNFPDVLSDGNDVTDVASYGEVVSDVPSDGNDTSVVASDGNIFSDVFPDTDFVSTVPSEAPVEAVVKGEVSAEESTTSEVPSQEETIDITEIMENENLYRCKKCVKTFATRTRFYDHENSHKILKCEVCQQVMKRYSMKQHMRIHAGYRPYVCEHCPNSSYIRLAHLAQHMRKKHNADANWSRDYVVKAEDVRKTQKEMVQPQNRIKNETISTNVAAADVGIGDADPDDRLQDRAVQNVDNSDIMQTQVHKCKFCEKVFNDVNHLNNHVNIHIQTRDYQCRFCGEKFVFPERLTRHIVYHTGSFKCSICQTLHPTYTKLQQHEKVEHPLHCKMCSRKCETTAELMEHLQFHKNIHFQCMQCMKVFNHRTTLWKHEKEEHGDPSKAAHQNMVKEEVKNKDETSDETSEVVIHPDVQIQDIPDGLQLQGSQQHDIGQQQHEVQVQESLGHGEQIQDIPEKFQPPNEKKKAKRKREEENEVQLQESPGHGEQIQDIPEGFHLWTKKQKRKRAKWKEKQERGEKNEVQLQESPGRGEQIQDTPEGFQQPNEKKKGFKKKAKKKKKEKRLVNSDGTIKWSKSLNFLHKCGFCGKYCQSKGSKIVHERGHTGERPFRCRIGCSKAFINIYSRNQHERCVQHEWSCDFCDKRCESKASKKEHERSHRRERPLSCRLGCSQVFVSEKIRKQHERCVHLRECRVPCKVCNQIYDSCRQVRHDRVCPGNGQTAPKPGVKYYSCDYCNKPMRDSIHKREHEMNHTGERPFGCRLGCNQRFKKQSHMERHEHHVHLKTCRLVCEVCNKNYCSCIKWEHARKCKQQNNHGI